MKKRSVKSDAEFEEARLGIKELESLKQIERQYLRNILTSLFENIVFNSF